MVVANLLDLAVGKFDHFGADRFNYFVEARTSAVEDRFRHAVTRIACQHLQVTTAVRHRRKTGLVMTLNLVAALEASSGRVDYRRMAVEAGHHRFQVMAIECIEVTL